MEKVSFQVVKSVTPFENGAAPVTTQIDLDKIGPDQEGLERFLAAFHTAMEAFMVSEDGIVEVEKDTPFTVAITFGG